MSIYLTLVIILGFPFIIFFFLSLPEKRKKVSKKFGTIALVFLYLMGFLVMLHILNYVFKTPENSAHRVSSIVLPNYKENTLTVSFADSIQDLHVRPGEIKDFDICCDADPEKDCGCLETYTDPLSLKVRARVVSCPDRLMPLENVCSKPKIKKTEDVFQVEED